MDPPDAFSRFLPLPFRLQGELILGIWLWALNVHGFERLHLDIFTLIRYPTRPSSTADDDLNLDTYSPSTHDNEPPLHVSTYRLAALCTALWVLALAAFWLLTFGDAGAVITHQWIPNVLGLLLLAVVFAPRPSWARPLYGGGAASRAGVKRLWTGLVRVAPGGIAGSSRGEKFGDVLLADALTSYAKPISEVAVTVCVLATRGSTTAKPDRLCGHELVVPLAIAWPFVVRFLQCVKEGQRANALKYATAFPVIVLSTMARSDSAIIHLAKNIASIVNSLYSFWWDVTMDWDLTLFLSPSQRHQKPFGLRGQRVFQPMVYYCVIAFDLVLRFAWSWKLSLAIVYLDGIEGGIFLLEVFELVRRWVWVYFRVEAESIRTASTASIAL